MLKFDVEVQRDVGPVQLVAVIVRAPELLLNVGCEAPRFLFCAGLEPRGKRLLQVLRLSTRYLDFGYLLL